MVNGVSASAMMAGLMSKGRPQETHMAQVIGTAVHPDGTSIGVRGLDQAGNEIAFAIPAALLELFVATLGRSAEAATRKRKGAAAGEMQVTVQRPRQFRVEPCDPVDGVALIFEPGTPLVQAFGFPVPGAMAMANALGEAAAAQHNKKPRLIIPRG
jgi:hypothetical protein